MNIIRWLLNRTRQYINYGREQFNFENFRGSVVIQNGEIPTRPRFEWLLLQQVEREVASRLEQSLHNKVLIILDKQALLIIEACYQKFNQ